MLRLPPSTFRIEEVRNQKAKFLSCVDVKAFNFLILNSGSAEEEIQMLSCMNLEASSFRIAYMQKQKAKCLSHIMIEACAFRIMHSKKPNVYVMWMLRLLPSRFCIEDVWK